MAPIGRNGIDRLLGVIDDPADDRLPTEARTCLEMLVAQLGIMKEQILENDRRIMAGARSTELGGRLMEMPGVGPSTHGSFADRQLFRGRGPKQTVGFQGQHRRARASEFGVGKRLAAFKPMG